jgi:hypothetical protein
MCCEEFNVNASFDSHLQCQFELVRMELAQLVANRVEDASRPLHEEVARLKLLLARIGVSLEPTEACSSGGQELATVQALCSLDSAEPKSSVVEITPEIHELCGDSSVVHELLELSGGVVTPLSIGEVRSDSYEISVVTSPPSQTLCFEKSGVADAYVSLLSESDRHVVHIRDGVAKSGLLATVPRVVIARDVFDFLASLPVAYPGSVFD